MKKENHKSQKQIRHEKNRAQKNKQQWIGYDVLALILLAAVFFISSRLEAQPLDEVHLAGDA